jgi:hypothetical protein
MVVQNEGILEKGKIFKHKIWERRVRRAISTSSRKPQTCIDIPQILIFFLGFFSTKHEILL